MDKILNEYLESIKKYLKPMSLSERLDIVNEIKSEIIELQNAGMSPDEIINRLGDARTLAGAYLGENIAKRPSFSFRRLAQIMAFYSFSGLGGIVVLPTTSILAVTFLACGFLVPLAGIVKFAAYLLGYDIPIIMFNIGSYMASPPIALVLSVISGIIFLLLGKFMWKLTIMFVMFVLKGKKKMAK